MKSEYGNFKQIGFSPSSLSRPQIVVVKEEPERFCPENLNHLK
jgi:hypothetical protein